MAASGETSKPELQRLVLEHVLQRMAKVRDDYNVQLQELFFLQTGGNIMDFLSWKRRPTRHLEEFMAQNRLDEDDVPSLPLSGTTGSDRSSKGRDESVVKEDVLLTTASIGDRSATASLSARSQVEDGMQRFQPVASGPSSQEQIAMQAKQEATVLKRVAELTMEGLWSAKRLPKVHEPSRKKTHWDYLLEEMQWLATDFAQERRWKKAAARKLAASVAKQHTQRLQKEHRAEKEGVARLKRIASNVAKEVRQFWANVEKIVQYKLHCRLAEKRKKALDMHLNFIVGQTEKYSSWLMEGMSGPAGTSTTTSSRSLSREVSVAGSGSELDESDLASESDDEATIEKEEAAPNQEILAHDDELKLLEEEATLDIDQLKSSLPSEIFAEPAKPIFRDSSDESEEEEEGEGEEVDKDEQQEVPMEKQSQTVEEVSGPRTRSRKLPVEVTAGAEMESADDKDFTVTEEMDAGEGCDDEETMELEEREEGVVDHHRELEDLKEEGDMPMEELLKMYGHQGPPSETVSESAEISSLAETEDEEEESDDNNDVVSISKDRDGIEQLVTSGDSSGSVKGPEELNSVAAAAEQLQPTGITLDSTSVQTPVPFLLKHKLREYQHIGLDWLVTMHDKTLNGILADEMGLGKTMQTIALLAHLACERGVWGPHLIVVPTSVVLNWEMEIKKWCPAFKILTYWGSIKERKMKRQGWTKHNTFHVCITSYKLVVQDNHIFRRKKWKYFILDEAQNIKNFKSQRWQVLLNFNSQRRLLLTGTPLQNSLMELWSLMHFLMPHVFASHQEFREWFSNPLTGMIEGSREYNESLVKRLHKVLRPFLLRRLKSEVEKQLPSKYEHVIKCRLSKRQRFLYDDFMGRTKTKETLSSGNFLSVINILMQLRKVCNHPDLFETRPIVSPFVTEGITFYTASMVVSALVKDPFEIIDDLPYMNVSLVDLELSMDAFAAQRSHGLQTPKKLIVELSSPSPTPTASTPAEEVPNMSIDGSVHASPGIPVLPHDEEITMFNHLASHSSRQYSTRASAVISSLGGESTVQSLAVPGVVHRRAMALDSRQDYLHRINTCRCSRRPLYGLDTRAALDVNKQDRQDDPFDFDSRHLEHWSWQARSHRACSLTQRTELSTRQLYWLCSHHLQQAIHRPCDRAQQLDELLKRFIMWIPKVVSVPIEMHASHTPPSMLREQALYRTMLDKELSTLPPLLHPMATAMELQFPETRLIQYDCGKLQTLDRLLRQLKVESHRVLIFTQMTRMLDILEAFLNYHGHTYFRLDGTTRIDRRQQLMDHFNMDKRIFCFILSTRSGGIGVNLTGADTVIFYDSDWNPTMDAQAQDRCHRIGQTRDVNIYRLISEHTVEENILKKAKQKRLLGDVAIEGGGFTTDFFKQRDIRDIFDLEGEESSSIAQTTSEAVDLTEKQLEEALANAEDEQDVLAARQAKAEQVAELAEFSETATDEQQGESRTGMTEPEGEMSKTEQELAELESQLTPVERYAVHLVEDAMSDFMDWQLKAAEDQVENDKKKWELSHLQALKQAEELKAEEEEEVMLTYSQEDVQDKVKRKRKRRRSFSDDDSVIMGSNSLSKSGLEASLDDHVDTSTPARTRPRRSKRSTYLDDHEYYPGDGAFEASLAGRSTQSRTSRRRQVSDGLSALAASATPKVNTRTATRNSSQAASSIMPSSVSVAGHLPSGLAGGMVMTPVMMQPNQSALPVTTVPLNYAVAPAGVRALAPTSVAASTAYSAPGGQYMFVTVGSDGQSVCRKVVSLPPNVVFRVVPMSVGTGKPANQANQ